MFEHLRFNHGKIYTAQVHIGHGDGKPLRPGDNVGVIAVIFSCDPSEGPTLMRCYVFKRNSEEDILTVLEMGQLTCEIELQPREVQHGHPSLKHIVVECPLSFL